MDSHSLPQQSRKRAREEASPAPSDHEIQQARKKTRRNTAEGLGTKDDPVNFTHDEDPAGPATPQSLQDISVTGNQKTQVSTKEQEKKQKLPGPASDFHTVFPTIPAPSTTAYITPDHIQRLLAPTSNELARAESQAYAPKNLDFRRKLWLQTIEHVADDDDGMTREQWEGDYFELTDLPPRQPPRLAAQSEQTNISETTKKGGDEF